MRITRIAISFLLLCLFAPAIWADSAKIPIYVTPFYDSQGPAIFVGKYSKDLATNDKKELKETIVEMLSEKAILTPEQMYVASIRLYEFGEKDEAVYWFYEAQYRARLFDAAISQSGIDQYKGSYLYQKYVAFHELAGPEINGYAGCDPEKWVEIMIKVKVSNLKSPDLQQIFPGVAFVAIEKWDALNAEVSSGLDEFLKFIKKSKPTWKETRAQNNADEKYCN